MVEGLNFTYDEHTAVDTTRLRRMFTKALVGGIIPYELSEWMPYLPRKALEDVMNILRVRSRYKWNVVYPVQQVPTGFYDHHPFLRGPHLKKCYYILQNSLL